MNGLLQRLGARAIGEPIGVRSASRLPFAAVPALAEASWQVAESVPPRALMARNIPAVTIDEPAQRTDQALWTPPAASETRPIPSPPELLPAATAGAEPSVANVTAPHADAGHSPPETLAARRPSDSGRAEPVRDPAPRHPETGPPRDQEAHADGHNGHGTHAVHAVHAVGQPGFRTIEPLLPALSAAHPTRFGDGAPISGPPRDHPAPDQARARARAQAQAGVGIGAGVGVGVEETTEVHVTIGRIEVTAVHEPAAPRRPAPPGPAPMSLDDYLASRTGGPSGRSP